MASIHSFDPQLPQTTSSSMIRCVEELPGLTSLPSRCAPVSCVGPLHVEQPLELASTIVLPPRDRRAFRKNLYLSLIHFASPYPLGSAASVHFCSTEECTNA